MLETKYGLKYPMPHVLVHIVDNSAYTGDLPVVVADNPSMYGTLVVTGMPMGEDNRVIQITRSDILNVAYGLNQLSSADIEKYGQTITYPLALIDQGAPIQLLRVTPDDATYAYSCITIEWRWDTEDRTMHVRYNTAKLANDRDLMQYKNKDRLNAAIVKSVAADHVVDSEGHKWTRRAFLVNISAGRGSAYNRFNTAINQTMQAKRPANIRYLFSTIDTSINVTVEQFYASLINENNIRDDYIDPVNIVIKKRAQGSSIVVPYLNEAAVRELYNEYRHYFEDMMTDNSIVITDYINRAYKQLTINTFDPIFGLYIYEGTDELNKLPFFQVDMRSADVPELPEANRIAYSSSEIVKPVTQEQYEINLLGDKLMPVTAGIYANTTESGVAIAYNAYIGDVYLYGGLTSLNNPYIYIVAAINQYTGAITTVRTNQLHFVSTSGTVIDEHSKLASIIEASTDEAFYTTLAEKLRRKYVQDGETVAWRNTADPEVSPAWTLWYVVPGAYNMALAGTFVSTASSGNRDTVLRQYTTDTYSFIDWNNSSYTAGVNGGTLIGTDPTDIAYARPGATRIDKTVQWGPGAQVVFVNGYDITSKTVDTAHSYVVGNRTADYILKYGAPDAKVTPIVDDVVGTQFDLFKCDSTASPTRQLATTDGVWSKNDGTEPKTTTIAPATNAKIGMKLGDDDDANLILLNPLPSSGDNYDIGVYKNGEVSKEFVDVTNIPNDTKLYLATDVYNGYYHDSKFYRTKEDDTYSDEITGDENSLYYDLDGTAKWYKFTSGTPGTFSAINDITHKWQILRWYAPSAGTGTWNVVNHDGDTPLPGSVASVFTTMSVTDFEEVLDERSAEQITRYTVTGTIGSLFRVQQMTVNIKKDYYSSEYGINITSESGGIALEDGYTGFFDDNVSSIEFKWNYSQLLYAAYKGRIDPRIMSPVRTPAKYLFDGATNTIVGQTILPNMAYSAADLIAASTIFTDDEKDEILFNPKIIKGWSGDAELDVKQAMYDLMDHRIYQGIPEDKRPLGPGSGLSLHLDSGYTDTTTATAINNSFKKRFDNPNASWDIGGYVSTLDGITYTFTKKIVDNLVNHCKTYSVNKPYTNLYTQIRKEEYSSYFPDIDTTDWEYRALMYNSGGNAWLPDVNGTLMRRSQRTLMRGSDTSDLIQESNMRTLSQLCYLLQNKLEEKLFEYNDDSVLRTMSDEVNNMFSNWPGNLVESLNITFERDINPLDGGELVVCYVDVVFRGINLRIPVIVNVNRRDTTTT